MALLTGLMVTAFVFYALTAAISKALRWYLWAHVINAPAVWIAYYVLVVWLHAPDWAYTVAYATLLAPCLVTLLLIALFALPVHPNPLAAMLVPPAVSAILVAIVLHGLTHPSAGVCIQLAEGGISVWGGALLGFCAPYYGTRMGREAAYTLSFLWVAQAGFRYGYVLHMGQSQWETANQVIPPMLVCGACAWLGRRLRLLTHNNTNYITQQAQSQQASASRIHVRVGIEEPTDCGTGEHQRRQVQQGLT